MAEMAPTNRPRRRLMKDYQELIRFPLDNVWAAPLESDLFQCHCNIKQGSEIYHVMMVFSSYYYPYVPPAVGFLPFGMMYEEHEIYEDILLDPDCLVISSTNFDYGPDYINTTVGRWSPGFTIKTVLLNVISFLSEHCRPSDKGYDKKCRTYQCPDCGHTYENPFPPLKLKETKSEKHEASETSLQIVDYISKEKFDPSREQTIFGYGLTLTNTECGKTFTTSFEFLTSESFYNIKDTPALCCTALRRNLDCFMPLYINYQHGSKIRNEFETMLKSGGRLLFPPNFFYKLLERLDIISINCNNADVILAIIPNIMCSIVVEFSKGGTHFDGNSLQGYFALHSLFLWASEMYPELQTKVEKILGSFVTEPKHRTKHTCPDLGQYLMLLSVSKRFTWKSVAQAFLTESFKRNVSWYVQNNINLANLDLPQKERLEQTFRLTIDSRNLLAFQVTFLKIAKPDALNIEQILSRYESSLGLPTAEMIIEMKEVYHKLKSSTKIISYKEWYHTLGLDYPSDASLFESLKDSVLYARDTKGYRWDDKLLGRESEI